MLQYSLFPPASTWTPPRLSDCPANWNNSPRLAIDVETCDPLLVKLGPGVRRGGYVVGICFALTKEKGFYLPLRHLGGDNMEDPDQAVRYVREQAAAFTGEVVGAMLDYDLDFLEEMGITFPNAKAFKDVQVAEPLLDELQFSYSLDSILTRHGMRPKDEVLFREAIASFKLDAKHPKKDLWKLPARYVGVYGERDVTAPLELMERQEVELEKQNLGRIWRLEQQVTPVLVKMRRRGVRIDHDQLDKMERWSLSEEAAAWNQLHDLTGVRVAVGDAMKAEVIARALEAVDILPGRTSNGKPSITKEWLEALNHPAGAIIRRARKMSQLRTTFVNSIREHDVKGRVHCTFNQIVRQAEEGGDKTIGAAYGRLSCVDPNMQQQPARDPEIGPAWRKVYLADEGGEWGSLDYSQQEPRLAVHAAVASGASRIGEAAFASAKAAAKRYWEDRTTDAHTMFCQMVYGDDFVNWPKDKFKQTRTRLKNIFLGICYGEGEAKMCRELGLPTKIVLIRGRNVEVAGEEGQAILDQINKRVPYVKATSRAIEAVAKARGYIVTIGGRRCRFPKDHQGNYEWTHKGFNRFIQGGAADQTKRAMVELDREGFPLQLQIHDEFAMTLHGGREEGNRAAKVMEECVPLHVPSKVDVEIGPSWGEAA